MRSLSDLYHLALMRGTRTTFSLWQRLGLHVTPVHFHYPVPDTRALPESLWSSRSAPGIDFRDSAQLALLDEFARRFGPELRELPLDRPSDPTRYHVRNGAFESVDGEILYCMMRHFQPRRVIEIGSGNSTLLTAQALRANAVETGSAAEFTAIEPYPNAILQSGVPGLTRLIQSPVQDVGMDVFMSLDHGDVLFIDSSHVVATGSDVVYEFLEILPRLRPGVIVHVHDIFIPAEYKRDWIENRRIFWNEQYILQAMLANNPGWEILWAGSYMHLTHPDRLAGAIPSYDAATVWPASFWMRKMR